MRDGDDYDGGGCARQRAATLTPVPFLSRILFPYLKYYRGADKSLARPDREKTIERSPFFVRRGGNCCRGDLVGRIT